MSAITKALLNDLNPLNLCCCGRPAAHYPSLITFWFYPKEAAAMAAAYHAGKCIPCHTIDCYITKLETQP